MKHNTHSRHHRKEESSINTACGKESVTIVFASNAKYAPLLSVAIQSIVCNATNRQYDICVLYTSMALSQIRKIQGMSRDNISIRFFSVTDIADKMHLLNLHVSRHITVETYLRFIIPEFFRNRKKVLYIDCDVVATRDVAELFDLPLDRNTYLAAAHDTYILYLLGRGDRYFGETLRMSSPQDYFQAGVLLLNIEAFRRHHLIEKINTALERLKTPRFHDQDILNVVCEGHVQFLDGRWNVEYHMPLCTTDYEQILTPMELEEYEKCYSDAWILHFCGIRKPWADPSYPLSEVFWRYARLTPFYEEIFYTNTETNAEKALTGRIDASMKKAEDIGRALDEKIGASIMKVENIEKTLTKKVDASTKKAEDIGRALNEKTGASTKKAEDIEKVLTRKIDDSTKNIETVRDIVRTLRDEIKKRDTEKDAKIAGLRKQLQQLKEAEREIAQLGDYQRKLKRVRWKAHLSWGKRRQRYLARKKQLKEKILFIEKFIKTK